MSKYNDSSTEKIICSHQIYKILAKIDPCFFKSVEQNKDLDLYEYGTFTLQDFIKIVNRDP